MTLLSWSKQYAIGNAVIDTEHEVLFGLINDFHDRWVASQDREEIARLLSRLIAYTEQHFRHEETIMRESQYPAADKHCAIHDGMIETIFRLRQQLEADDLRLEVDAQRFLKSWMLEHILQTDYLFRDFLARSRKAPETAAEPAQPAQ